MEIKAKINNKWDLLKLKSFSTAMETINKMKRQPTDWKRIFANDVTVKGLISKIYSLWCVTASKQTIHSKNGQIWIDISPKKIYRWPIPHKKMFNITAAATAAKSLHSCPTLCDPITREMQIKTTMRYHFILITMVIINKSTNNKC